jgi:DNA-binding response OmpR family regulator
LTEPPRILIVEDDPAIAQLIATLLETNWFYSVVRCSGAQGVQAFAKESIDLIITDLHMPAGDGIALIQAVRRTSQTPVIIVTGFAKEYADHVRFLDNVAVIHKPFETQTLLDTVEMALEASSRGGKIGRTLKPQSRPADR